MILQKYIPAINSIIIVVLSALIAIPSGQLNWTTAAQLVAIGLSAVGLYFAPLLDIKWRGIMKVGIAVIGALVATAFPIFNTLVAGAPFKPIYLAFIVLAVVHALGTQVGVDIRTDTSAIIGADQLPPTSGVNQEEPIITNNLETLNPGYFAAGAGPQTPPPEYLPSTAQISAVNPANQE